MRGKRVDGGGEGEKMVVIREVHHKATGSKSLI